MIQPIEKISDIFIAKSIQSIENSDFHNFAYYTLLCVTEFDDLVGVKLMIDNEFNKLDADDLKKVMAEFDTEISWLIDEVLSEKSQTDRLNEFYGYLTGHDQVQLAFKPPENRKIEDQRFQKISLDTVKLSKDVLAKLSKDVLANQIEMITRKKDFIGTKIKGGSASVEVKSEGKILIINLKEILEQAANKMLARTILAGSHKPIEVIHKNNLTFEVFYEDGKIQIKIKKE